MKTWTLFLALIFSVERMSAAELPHYAVDDSEINSSTKNCNSAPSLETVRKDIYNNDEKFLYVINDLRIDNLSRKDAKLLHELTVDRSSYFVFRCTEAKENNFYGVNSIQRKFVQDPILCPQSNAEIRNKFVFGELAKESCPDLKCALNKIFGEITGEYVFWAYKMLHLNLSRYQDHFFGADFSLPTLKKIIDSALLVPKKFRKQFFSHGKGFFRFVVKEGVDYRPEGTPPGTLITGNGAVLLGFFNREKVSPLRQKYLILHEVGHWAGGYVPEELWEYDNPSPDQSVEWRSISTSPKKISKISKMNYLEDFAESFVTYRLAPKKLKKDWPYRYNFIKKHVFEGIEFNVNKCNGSKEFQ